MDNYAAHNSRGQTTRHKTNKFYKHSVHKFTPWSFKTDITGSIKRNGNTGFNTGIGNLWTGQLTNPGNPRDKPWKKSWVGAILKTVCIRNTFPNYHSYLNNTLVATMLLVNMTNTYEYKHVTYHLRTPLFLDNILSGKHLSVQMLTNIQWISW